MSGDPFVSVTVCVRDGAHWIEGCLDSLLEQTYSSFEVLVVNDGSTDGAEEILARYHDPEGANGTPVRVHHQPPLGLSAGRQWAVEHAIGEWVAITDIDVRPEPDWIANMVAQIAPVDEQERVVAVTGRTVFEQADDLVSRLRSVEIAAKYRARPRRTSLANGPCSMFHRASLMEVGGFDPAWYHAEDMEVSLRLNQAGGTIVYARDALVKHVPETGARHFLAKRRRDARAHVRIVRHHPKRRRQGPGFDFLGSSTMILCLFPLWMAFMVSVFPFLVGLYTGNMTIDRSALEHWEGQVLLVSIVALLVHELLLWRGRLGVVNREVMRSTHHGKFIAMLGVRRLTFLWSLALWQGLLLGCLDALLGRNGHKR
ncbi:MAG TPA: glycosyltransferase family 2 protein [Candidatus Poseidoniales archaeon]|nr:MAG TPA: glycosyltransferase family 2 protein [Candidatus Poseidoniales archaeon]HII77947.1 glycosyltransferase family 2 protein [Poseidonia sp.]